MQLNIFVQDSDIRISSLNEFYQEEPYTFQYGQCGTPGKYIYIPNNFVTGADESPLFGNSG